MITVLTATFNRGYLLPLLYESLRKQTCKQFEWFIIDDGSDDESQLIINEWVNCEKDFEIRYIRKCNGGKHRAINYAARLIKSPFTFIVDSDDILTENAIQAVSSWIEAIAHDVTFAGVAGLCGYSLNQKIGEYPKGKKKGYYIDATNLQRRKVHLLGDKAEVYRTALLRKYPFPEIEGEKFITESLVWNQIAMEGYKIRWFNEIIYLAHYLEEGLTKNLHKLRLENFKGYTMEVKQNFKSESPLYKYRILGRYYLLAKEKGMTQSQTCNLLSISKVHLLLGELVSVLQSFKDKCEAGGE